MTNNCDLCKKATIVTDRVYQMALDTVADILEKAGYELHEFTLECSGATAGFAVVDTESQEVVIPAKIRDGEYENPVPLDTVIKWAEENILADFPGGTDEKICRYCEESLHEKGVNEPRDTDWPQFYTEPEIGIPLVLWQDFLTGTLERTMEKINNTKYPEDTLFAEVRPMLSEVLCFCNYVMENHAP